MFNNYGSYKIPTKKKKVFFVIQMTMAVIKISRFTIGNSISLERCQTFWKYSHANDRQHQEKIVLKILMINYLTP